MGIGYENYVFWCFMALVFMRMVLYVFTPKLCSHQRKCGYLIRDVLILLLAYQVCGILNDFQWRYDDQDLNWLVLWAILMGLFAWSFADFLRMFNSRLALKRVALPKPHKGTIKFKSKPFNPVDSAYVSVHLLVQMMLYTVLFGFWIFLGTSVWSYVQPIQKFSAQKQVVEYSLEEQVALKLLKYRDGTFRGMKFYTEGGEYVFMDITTPEAIWRQTLPDLFRVYPGSEKAFFPNTFVEQLHFYSVNDIQSSVLVSKMKGGMRHREMVYSVEPKLLNQYVVKTNPLPPKHTHGVALLLFVFLAAGITIKLVKRIRQVMVHDLENA